MRQNKILTSYFKFFGMIATSVILMFFLMYLNSYRILEHAWFSETRFFMTLIMGSTMTVVMLIFMLNMYQNKYVNGAIFIGAALTLLVGIWLVRSQVAVTDIDFMEGMIPHHSIAILTSERAKILDPRVRKLANEILSAQRREIKEMEWLISDIQDHGPAENQKEAEARPVPASLFMGH